MPDPTRDTAATRRTCCATVGGEPHTSECEAIWRATRDFPQDRPCPTKTPEPHLLGEFPMTCYRCHIEADS